MRIPPARLLVRSGHFNPRALADHLRAEMGRERPHGLVPCRVPPVDDTAAALPGPRADQIGEGGGGIAAMRVGGEQQLDGGALAVEQVAGVGDVDQADHRFVAERDVAVAPQVGDQLPEAVLPGAVRDRRRLARSLEEREDGVGIGTPQAATADRAAQHQHPPAYHTRRTWRALPCAAGNGRRCAGDVVAAAMAEEAGGLEPLVVTTGEMAYGPHAVARVDGKVVFVRGAAPHEEAEVRVREDRERFAFADLVAVRRPSTVRRSPPCPYLPRCGGCPWQHLDYAAQLAAKQRIVGEQLQRLAGLAVPVAAPLPSPRELGYRRRVKLRVADGVVGFHAAASHDLVAITHCLLAEPRVDAAIPWLAELVAALRSGVRRLEIAAGGRDAGVVVAGEVEGAWHDGDAGACQDWLAAHPDVAGLLLRGRGWTRTWGGPTIDLDAGDDQPLRVRAPAFSQVNGEANRLLVEQVVQRVAPRPGLRVLDLYAGAGNLSLPLRRRGALVTAVEQDRGAAADARANAAREAGPPLRVLAMPAERAVRQFADAGERFDAVVLDPPRSGAAACVVSLLRLQAPRLVYVSCDPSTLARDLRHLSTAYCVDDVQPIDFFPHTYHIETVVGATLACDPQTPGVAFDQRRDARDPRARHRRRRRMS